MYIAKLPTGKRVTLAILEVGRSFGEMSVLDPMGTVSAGIYANEELDLLILELSWLGKLFETERTHPLLHCVCCVYCVCV